MKCRKCEQNKLSKDFPRQPFSEECQHAMLMCLRCVVKSIESAPQCPYPDCGVVIENLQDCLAPMKLTLHHLYPEPEQVSPAASFQPLPPGGGTGRLVGTLINGEHIDLPYQPAMTVRQLMMHAGEKLGQPWEKIKLLYNAQELKVTEENATACTLSKYGINAGSTLIVMVLLLAIPRDIDHVIFDMFWGYPAKGQDYLDASCLVYKGAQFEGVVDYRNRSFKEVIKHSGDVMDETKRQGHHTIHVKLHEIPECVTHLVFTLSAWNSPTISHFPNPSLKFFKATDKTKDLCNTSFAHAGHSQAITMCVVTRRTGGWQIINSGRLSAGNARNYEPLQATVGQILATGI